jgi:hypothetical protein
VSAETRSLRSDGAADTAERVFVAGRGKRTESADGAGDERDRMKSEDAFGRVGAGFPMFSHSANSRRIREFTATRFVDVGRTTGKQTPSRF